MLLGAYERAGVPWSLEITPWDFGQALLPTDLERIAPSLEKAFEHFPALRQAGIRRVINGPFTFAPDGNPLVGPVQGLRNFWVACGVMAGFSQAGGVGLALARWMVDGDPGADIWAMDIARYGPWASPGYTHARVRETYARRFRIRFPGEEMEAARPLATTPIHDLLRAENAVFGEYCALEHALWFAPPGTPAAETASFHRTHAHGPVGAECHAVRTGVGLIETSHYGKIEVRGDGAAAWLSGLMAGRMPPPGRIALSPMLNERGKLIGDYTLCRLTPEHVLLIGAYAAESHCLRWLEQHPPPPGVTVRPCTLKYAGLALAGPGSRALLHALVREDLATERFPFLSFRRLQIGPVPALVGRISFTGEQGYELWVRSELQRALYTLLMEAGRTAGLRLFGARALDSLRLEKSFGTWAREYRPVHGPLEAGLARFVDWDKGDFIGRAAALEERASGGQRRLAAFAVLAGDADASGDEPIWHEGQVVGWVTSGGYGHTVQTSLALGYIPARLAAADSGFEVEILGERRPATRLNAPLVDPDGTRMRA